MEELKAFKKYQHIERYGTPEVQGITDGLCYIFPKIDGTNASIWDNEDTGICYGSRNRQLSLLADNAGFMGSMETNIQIKLFFEENPNLRLFGEWLVPHSLKIYHKDAWRKFYVFDIMDENGVYLSYDEYSKLLSPYNIDFIKPLAIIKNPTLATLEKWCKWNTFLIEEGKGIGEGIVIKNYSFSNERGRVVWAKLLSEEFKSLRNDTRPNKEYVKPIVEQEFINTHLTDVFIKKEMAKIIASTGEWGNKQIPKLMGVVYYEFIKEELYIFINSKRNPVMNFKSVRYLSDKRVKNYLGL